MDFTLIFLPPAYCEHSWLHLQYRKKMSICNKEKKKQTKHKTTKPTNQKK